MIFKIFFNYAESLHRKSLCYTCFEKFWVVENSFIIATKLKKINAKTSNLIDMHYLNTYLNTLS